MVAIINALIDYLFISYSNDPIKQYCQTEYKKDWKRKYFELTGKSIN